MNLTICFLLYSSTQISPRVVRRNTFEFAIDQTSCLVLAAAFWGHQRCIDCSSCSTARLTEIARGASWINGRATNSANNGKNNQQIEPGPARDESGNRLSEALRATLTFDEIALPVAVAPPLLSRYAPGMAYAIHGDNASIHVRSQTLRNDLACTIFLADPASYDGGALVIHSGDVRAAFRLPAGYAILYPATMLHEVEQVTRGERLAAFTFIQSRIADPARRAIVAELTTIARTERERLDPAAHARLLVVQQNLMRDWGDAP